jgi:hypothetical protein
MPHPQINLKHLKHALEQCHGLVSAAARMLGCEQWQIRKKIDKHPELLEIIRSARDELVDTAELSLRRRVLDGEGWAVKFALESLGKDRGYAREPDPTTVITPPPTVHIDLAQLLSREDFIGYAQQQSQQGLLESCLIGSDPSLSGGNGVTGPMAAGSPPLGHRPSRDTVYPPEPNGNGHQPHSPH